MAWRLKIFLLMLGLTGACMFCFQQVLVPSSSNFSGQGIRQLVRTETSDSSFERAKLLVDKVIKKGDPGRNRHTKITGLDPIHTETKSDHRDVEKHLENSKESIINLPISNKMATGGDSEDYVTMSANGSLVYQIATDFVDTVMDEKIIQRHESGWGITTTMSPTDLEEEHDARIKHLREECKKIPTLKASLVGRGNITDFFYTQKYKFAYCKVPKSGSTFWMQLFMVLGRGDKYTRLMQRWTRAQIHERTRRLQVNPLKILKERLRTIVVSRNPFTRIYSAYIDKVFMPLFWEQFRSIPSVKVLEPILINRTVRSYNVGVPKRPERFKQRQKGSLQDKSNDRPYNFSDQYWRERYKNRQSLNFSSPRFVTKLVKVTPVCANHVTFEDFLKFIISETKRLKALEPHWAPITHLCRPCRINTYKVVKQESFASDVEHSLKSFGIELSVHKELKESLTEGRAESSIPGIVGVLMDKALAPEIQKCISPKEIAERIWKSFQIQGFISNEISIPKDGLPDNIRQLKLSLISAALDAVKESKFTRAEQKTQRRKHLIEAYSHVSPDVIEDIQRIYLLDFKLFDYSQTPPHLEGN